MFNILMIRSDTHILPFLKGIELRTDICAIMPTSLNDGIANLIKILMADMRLIQKNQDIPIGIGMAVTTGS